MTRYLLDTNIISHVIKPAPSRSLLDWMEAQEDENLFIATLTLAELRRGILETQAGHWQDGLEAWFSGPEGPQKIFAGRILAFDDRAALEWAGLMSEGQAAGLPRGPMDMIITAIAIANDCVIVTDNDRDFFGLEMINPLRGD